MAKGFPDWSGPKVGVYLQPEWAAKEGTDKTFTADGSNITRGLYVLEDYLVPADKTLYIVSLSFAGFGFAAGDSDNNQFCEGSLMNLTDNEIYVSLAGNGGASIVLSKPAVFKAGKTMRIFEYNRANHACYLTVSAQGYEI